MKRMNWVYQAGHGRHETQVDAVKLRTVYRRFTPYLRPYLLQITGLAVTLIAQIGTDVLQPWPMKFAFDNVIGHHHLHGVLGNIVHTVAGTNRLSLLNLIIIGFLVIVLLDAIFSYYSGLLLATIGQRAMFDIRKDLFAHVQRLSLRFHGNNQTGDLISRVTGDISNIQDMIVTATSTIFVNVLTVIFMVAIMLKLDWRYTILTITIVPFMYLASRYFRRAMRSAAMQVRRSEGQVSSIVQEVITSIRVVKAFTREDYEQERFERQSDVSMNAGLKMGKLQAQFTPTLDILGSFATVILLWFGVREVLNGHLTAGELLVFVSYVRGMYSPIRQLARVANTMARGSAGAERIMEIFTIEADLHDNPGAHPAPRFRGHVVFDRVSFGYNPDELVLRDVSFEAEPGSVVALVGATGSGKTTTVSMVPRFYDPTAGAVVVDGIDVREYTLRSLRSQVSLVLQEPLLFKASIYDNVAYGKADASATEIRAALEAANAWDFVMRLPGKEETVVGERGGTLSGGQRQRIAIARAMIRDASILILDEPTVGLDPETEAMVLDALDRLRRGRTTFVIAHHLTTVHTADHIIVLDEGCVVEMGSHGDLMQRNGRYARLYRSQDRGLGRSKKEAQTSA